MWYQLFSLPANYFKIPTVFLALADGRASHSLSLATKTLKTVTKMKDSEIPNKPDVIANLHSCIGNAHLELGQTDKALEHHQKDLSIANEQ